MKITILKENLSKGLNIIGRIVSTRGSLEVLSNILIKTEKGRVCLSATNLEVGINYMVGAKVESDGAITVPARLFSELINSLPGEKVTLELEGDTLRIKSDNYQSNIKGISADEFPLIPEIKTNKVCAIKSVVLKDAINLVVFAAATDDTRPVLAGVYIKIDGQKLTLATTDSYRLAEKIVDLGASAKTKKTELIIPAKTLLELGRILGELAEEETVNIYLSENQILFEANGLDFISRLIEGQFPNYKQIIPESSDTKSKVAKEEFLSAVKIASLFARENANSIKVSVKSKGEIIIDSQGSQIGDNKAKIRANVTGKDGEASFNGKYIIDALNAIREPEISLEISGKLNPGVINSTKDKGYIYIIMPLRN
ncbi:DNA polymerase III subunit beta [candidate division WS5 bacterium]|uniref:Beta sliding clamp n=1 Tax=candidate division WS5 bacterium TaxID=2093353 RepID=A0A419DGJ4_9BACT|nr:MAG: DNA polymerase III subunit beta [candidate division WS5 bacterium]